jgi:hypothetical protein
MQGGFGRSPPVGLGSPLILPVKPKGETGNDSEITEDKRGSKDWANRELANAGNRSNPISRKIAQLERMLRRCLCCLTRVFIGNTV